MKKFPDVFGDLVDGNYGDQDTVIQWVESVVEEVIFSGMDKCDKYLIVRHGEQISYVQAQAQKWVSVNHYPVDSFKDDTHSALAYLAYVVTIDNIEEAQH